MADQSAEVRVIKRKNAHEARHGGAWKVAYADFVTAMMAFFLVMWIVGLNQAVKEAIAGYFKDPVKFMTAVKSGNAPFAISSMQGMAKPVAPTVGSEAQERAKLEAAKASIEKMVEATAEFKDLRKYVDIQLADEGMRIDLLEAKESLFFDSASAKIKPSTARLLARIAAELGKLPNKVIIEGHTDSRPLNRADGYSNWELSADRSNSARQIMEESGVRADQIAQVRGYAATEPRDPANPEHFSNRRVSIVVVMNKALEQQRFGSFAKGVMP